MVPKTLKTNPLEPVASKVEAGAGCHCFEEGCSPSLHQTVAPGCIEELRKAAEEFDPGERVTAFVVMEDAALADAYASIHQVSPAAEKRMLQKQDAVIASIEDCVWRARSGGSLPVYVPDQRLFH